MGILSINIWSSDCLCSMTADMSVCFLFIILLRLFFIVVADVIIGILLKGLNRMQCVQEEKKIES